MGAGLVIGMLAMVVWGVSIDLCASLHYAYIVSIVKPNLVMLVQLIMLDLTCEALYRGPNLTRQLLNFQD